MSVTYPIGFLAAGISAGIKPSGKKDLALVFSKEPAIAAAVSTTNKFKAASLLLSLSHLRQAGEKQAVLLNSGNANAINGKEGMAITNRIVSALAKALKIDLPSILFASTGKIGLLLPEKKITGALSKLVKNLGQNGQAAAEAIMTTDRVSKETARETNISGRKGMVRLGGMAKGAGMIKPELATMLAVLTTDAVIEKEALQMALREAVNQSFNLITIDDDQSTNDFVVILANGEAANRRIKKETKEFYLFQEELTGCCLELAKKLAADGEGANKLIAVKVTGAWSLRDARRVSRRIAGSNLVKTAIAGESPNWGRILSSAGSCSARMNPQKISLSLAGTPVFDAGEIVAYPEKTMQKALAASEIEIELDLGMGNFSATAYGCDLTEDYVKINKEYS
ncbi:MAG: bifunctional glutamate N-acetyltransferase/amino-acid acetyltransferase ArgJ [Candidatus Omnitrophota bacterium]|nr:bifunctional glutamate N-acetyltransferase/amino-acid acetyltransferase ArgJ [Candidatus Omnitrophota bacterium]